ncbi:hypothetical protein BN1356_02193 [Streptococcus varani]|uniref:Uncharacterized protein n=1 Tax=Streptococcus varani TaxID=1608583 RepID=A0A0E4H6F3_9STRE|nr:hypothetical protein [Streptococcus varani]CQR25846.1 hypothetical protein BN1356_02193 [Streptococcus varani]
MKSLDNATLSFISGKVAEVFSGSDISSLAGEYCVISGISGGYRPQGRYESKQNFVQRIFANLEDSYQVGLIQYFVNQSPSLQSDMTVQQLLARLSQEFDILPKTLQEQERTKEIEVLLGSYPGSLDLWNRVMACRQSHQYRECLDNARLCLELLLKNILSNNKSIENQKTEFCTWLGTKSVPNEVVNMIWKSIDDYARIQNQHAKHALSEKLLPIEVDFILDETYTIIKYLTNKSKELPHE